MRTEYCSLLLTTVFFLFAWVPVSVGKYQTFGGKWLASNREKVDKELPPWAQRCERAYLNLKDYFPAFVVAILALGSLGKFDATTASASVIYFLARVVHYGAYGYGNVPLRFVGYVTGMSANIFLLVKCWG